MLAWTQKDMHGGWEQEELQDTDSPYTKKYKTFYSMV